MYGMVCVHYRFLSVYRQIFGKCHHLHVYLIDGGIYISQLDSRTLGL